MNIFGEFQNTPVKKRLVVRVQTYDAMIIHVMQLVDYRTENFFIHDGGLACVVVSVDGTKRAVVVVAVLRFNFD